ncbi:alpha/beta fold hydrolase [Blastococcus goldschmidtiae]|uniref:Alpha/beta hydrolase n=1 Tax=Blastococcus goldschmidtiae TaxID=3075546 RepID=A0ABU2K8R4_9ACTN|nr:alpha/beta hydrolase [Blastococcus sp. DSM 46792]MDT0276577.1 alpha/beta hydrolase [Blastococcus sp. DSM 46792]
MSSSPIRIVVVPGLGLDKRSWAGVLDRLPASVPATVLHLPGMGLGKPVPPLETLADEVRSRLGAGPVVLAGHSQSCQVVVAVAERDPRVVGVVLLGPTTDPRLRRVPGLVVAWLRTALREPWWQVPRILAQWLHTGPPAMRALWRRAAPDRIERRLSRVRVPVTVVRGSRDALCSADWAAAVAAAAPRGRLVEIPGAAHMTPQSHPAVVADLLRGGTGDPGDSRAR